MTRPNPRAAADAGWAGQREDVVEIDHRPPEFTDEALALRFAETYADRLRYVASWSRWLYWDGRRWQPDSTLLAFDFARKVCREVSATCNKKRVAVVIASAKTVAAVERLAKADRRIAATVDQWDSDVWLLNTPKGTINLRTGALQPHRREDYITKITAVAPGGDCPTWINFLFRVVGPEIAAYLGRVCGYALTGSTAENSLFFLHGTGANGKSVFINTVSGALGDYATTASMETFVASNIDRHPTELSSLRGARLVTATETEEGRRWAESRIKALTGGDRIAARFMRQDLFEFDPQFKLLIAGNHKPGLRGVDEAIRRRMNLIPFIVTIPVNERDENLAEKLKAEWPGILQWMINGCIEWSQNGLCRPDAVARATAEYLTAEDIIGAWIDECCLNNGYAITAELFASWRHYADEAGEYVGPQKRFSQALRDRGYTDKLQPGTGRAGFLGIRLKPSVSANS
jgi:putative DNA primase/helicase